MPAGNISADLDRKVRQRFASYVIGGGPGFGKHIGDKIHVKNLVVSLPDCKAMAVCEITVEQDMMDNAQGVLHAGCSAYLIDMCTALPYILLGLAQEEAMGPSTPTVFAMAPFAPSQKLEITFHHTASLGTQLRIACKSVALNGRMLAVRGEIWDVGKRVVVASASHTKVMPKKPPLIANLKL